MSFPFANDTPHGDGQARAERPRFVAEAMKDVPTTGCHWCVRDHATGRLRNDGLSERDARQVASDLNSDDDDDEPEFI